MIVVVEPGVAIKWFVEEPLRPQARSLLVHRHELIAPDILIAGVAELAWKKAASGEIAPDQAAPIVRSIGLPSFISAFVESTRLRNRALALALQCGRPVHDCFYAACAEAASATLVSSDETFLRALKAEGVTIPADINVLATYPLGVTTDAANPEGAAAWAAFITGGEGQSILAKYGFGAP